jgi:hypothetical protein
MLMYYFEFESALGPALHKRYTAKFYLLKGRSDLKDLNQNTGQLKTAQTATATAASLARSGAWWLGSVLVPRGLLSRRGLGVSLQAPPARLAPRPVPVPLAPEPLRVLVVVQLGHLSKQETRTSGIC